MAEYRTGESRKNQVQEPDMSGSYTARDYLSWTFDGLYELIRGKVYKMSPAPSTNHQRIALNITRRLIPHFNPGDRCELFFAPFDVFLVKSGDDWRKTRTVVEPDICIICDPSKINLHGCIGSPDFILEILSPSTATKDQREKFDIYGEYGVPEYWIADPFSRSVTRNILKTNGRYQIQRPSFEKEVVTPRQFPDLKIKVEDIFEGTTREDV